MCKFCSEFKTGEVNESLITEELPVIRWNLGIEVFVDDDELRLYVDSAPHGDIVLSKTIKINFCPICGRKFNENT